MSLDLFTDFALSTREHQLSGPGEIISQANPYQSQLFTRMMKGLGEETYVQAGDQIVDHVRFDMAGTFAHFGFNDTMSFSDANTLTRLKVDWRASKVHSVIHAAEVDLQNNNLAETFKRVDKIKESQRDEDWWVGMEESLLAEPDSVMETAAGGAAGGKPYSLLCFITPDGAYPSGFTTLMTVANTKEQWKNKFAYFDNTNNSTRRSETNGVIKALDRVYLQTQYKSPTTSQEYHQDTKMSKQLIIGNLTSVELAISITREMNSMLQPKTDIGYATGDGVVLFHNIPITYVPRLNQIDTDVANDPGDEPTAQDGASKKGYRFRFVNLNYFKAIFHRKHFRNLQELKDARQPLSRALFEDTWWNLWCSNRRAQGMVSPAA